MNQVTKSSFPSPIHAAATGRANPPGEPPHEPAQRDASPRKMVVVSEAFRECNWNMAHGGSCPAGMRAGMESLLPNPKIQEPNSTPSAPFAPSASRASARTKSLPAAVPWRPAGEADSVTSGGRTSAAGGRTPAGKARRPDGKSRTSASKSRMAAKFALLPANHCIMQELQPGASIPVKRPSKNRSAWCTPEQETSPRPGAGMKFAVVERSKPAGADYRL